MSEFGENARLNARRLNYTEFEAEEMAKKRAKIVGDVISEELEEPYIDELCSLLDIDGSEMGAVEITPQDVALAAWSNWGAGSFDRAVRKTSMTDDEFIILNDSFNNLYKMQDE